jgi:hypothetical protein
MLWSGCGAWAPGSEAVFRENDIDETVLQSLTHENLKALGVASFGHRAKLLDAIAALRNYASGKAPNDPCSVTRQLLISIAHR